LNNPATSSPAAPLPTPLDATAAPPPDASAPSPSASEPPPGDSARAQGAHDAILMEERRAKVRRIRAGGVDPFPHTFPDRTEIAAIHAAHDPAELEAGEHPELRCRVAGRVTARRGHGRTTFLDVLDRSGSIQLLARLAADDEDDAADAENRAGRVEPVDGPARQAAHGVGQEVYDRVLDLDVGDIVGADGCVYVTPRGQLALSVDGCTLLAKSLRPPPAKRHGLGDVEMRYRHREVDLMSNADTRRLFVTRARTIAALRGWMDEHGFIEVETPVLQVLAGGANARPFVTHHNALDRDLSLTISGEFHLKRCIVGGLERVYMLDKCFRNEGISHKHSPEFTLLEWEMSYADYRDVWRFMEDLVAGVAMRVLGTTTIEQHDGQTIELAPPWPRIPVREIIAERVGVDVDSADRAQLTDALGDRVPAHATRGQLVAALYSKLVEPHIVQPTIVHDFPVDFHPVVKRHRDDPDLIEHFEMVIRGIEVGSGSSELNDPDEQRRRFVDQRNQRPLDDGDEPYPGDEEFVRAMEYGMPPLGGAGIGVDRLLTIFTGRETLREVIPFPALRDRR